VCWYRLVLVLTWLPKTRSCPCCLGNFSLSHRTTAYNRSEGFFIPVSKEGSIMKHSSTPASLPISPGDSRKPGKPPGSWHRDLQLLYARHRRNAHIRLDPLYALPRDLVECLTTALPDWLSPAEVLLEKDLHALCELHQALGIFHALPMADSGLTRPPAPVFSENLLRELGWDRFWTLEKAEHLVELGLGRMDPLIERLDAYRGWLVTNRLFQNELQALRKRWGPLVSYLGRIRSYPVKMLASPKGRRPRNVRNKTEELVRAFDRFFERWDLQGLATWDLPATHGADFSGLSRVCLPASISLQIPISLALPASYPLRAIVEEAQCARMPAHLQGWLRIVRQQHTGDLRFLRLGRMFLLHYYRDTALASRYGDRFARHVEALDRAFGQFLGGLSSDSIKKLRLQMDALRRGVP
jgi:hypothetical protein